MQTGRCAGCSCHGCRTDTETHLGLRVLNHIIDVPNHHVDIVAAPVCKSHIHCRIIPQVVVLCTAVGGDAVGIKIVVKDYSVHIIIGDDFPDDVNDALACLGQAGVEDNGSSFAAGIGEQHAFIFQVFILGGIPVGASTPTVGIHPGVTLDAACVALLNGILQRVVARIPASSARQITRPWLVAGLVHSVTHRTHLEEDGIEVLCLEVVQIGIEFSLLGTGVILRLGPVDVIDSGYPCGAHLALQGLVSIEARCYTESNK